MVPIYVAIKGRIYDVSPAAELYGPSGRLNVYAGREPNRAIAMGSDCLSDMVHDVSDLTAKQLRNLDAWEQDFQQRFLPVGHVLWDSDPVSWPVAMQTGDGLSERSNSPLVA
eukprot:TRINITY_DN8922_c0_g1_i3.p2 TRINITY_DN8922_c0_g1~~TRINITY_DN8922_c0_g1_i3.p2  ORF type:complete len:112 (-),score=16.97 TRINITY_DN8922_c0_g1_i3:105-440(-)